MGHGAVTKPYPRKDPDIPYCAYCVGEHQPEKNPYGAVHRQTFPSKPCMGTVRDGERYTEVAYGPYRNISGSGPSSYTAGGNVYATIAIDADHGGEAQWSYCPHSEDETEECFRNRSFNEWTDVHAYWNGDSSIDHWKSGEHFKQTVRLSEGAVGRVTLRWLWICKWTDELFVSCIDIDVMPDDGTQTTLVQTSTSDQSERRAAAAAVLSRAAHKANNPKLATLAYRIKLDAFTRVKKAIDDMVAELLKEKEDEIKHKDFCVEEFNTNQLQTERKGKDQPLTKEHSSHHS